MRLGKQDLLCRGKNDYSIGEWKWRRLYDSVNNLSSTPQQVFNVRSYGAVGDGVVMDTAAIQNAIDAACTAGGGIVLIPAGHYLSAPLRLGSGLHLHLEQGALLQASPRAEDYPDWQQQADFLAHLAPYNSRYFLGAEGARDLSITGDGVVDGSAEAFYGPVPSGGTWAPVLDRRTRPARMVMLADCRNVVIEGVQFRNAPAWSFWVVGCERVRFENVRIDTSYHYINTDGIDIDGSRDVTIRNCKIRTGDDAVVLRAIKRVFAQPRACEQIRVENCTLASNCNAIRLAYLRDGDIRNVVMENLTISESRRGIICQVPIPEETPEKHLSHLNQPGPIVENIRFSNIRISAQRPIWVRVSEGARARYVGNLRFENLEICGSTPSLIEGSRDFRFANVVLENISFCVKEGPLLLNAPESGVRGAALIVTHCDNLVVRNVTVAGEHPDYPLETPALYFEEVDGLQVSEVQNRSAYPFTHAAGAEYTMIR